MLRLTQRAGFTLVELLLVMGITSILLGVVTVNLLRPQTKSALDASVLVLVSDLKQQQMKAMVGQSDGQPTSTSHGIHIGGSNYTLFQGTSYSSGAVSNFGVTLHPAVTASSTFTGSQIIFSRVTGEVLNFASGNNTITLQSIQDANQRTITLNRYGVATF